MLRAAVLEEDAPLLGENLNRSPTDPNFPRPSGVPIWKVPGEVVTMLRSSLIFPESMDLNSTEFVIKKAAEDYLTAFNQDGKTARNFLFMCTRDIFIGICVALFTAQLRRPDTPDNPNISNIVIVSLTVLGVLIAFFKEMLDVRTEFDKNYSSRQKALAEVQGHFKKSNKLQLDLDEANAKVNELESSVIEKVGKIYELGQRISSLEVEIDDSRGETIQLDKIQKAIEKSNIIHEKVLFKAISLIDNKTSIEIVNSKESLVPPLKRSSSCHF